ncbi:F0F1 ATP synthase subunit B' [Helicobacter cappadocius]|uniref:ATP synthase subunit b n=1 Tax=Helicobacter cappadocius TaxID=3063998 RepID=A0AA90PTT6_9HELI|nr:MULTISPECIES: F0F1 ATP synthase subunit B' [unclassified Helicobacter]MDO7252747.1 F0F1 ATP synthase subunit B' [Helicobacter sp. faydin-H75]MDP2538615.1 F0F1 ATP synthase subunit B' [Helicobacter sp. faydin-H76]
MTITVNPYLMLLVFIVFLVSVFFLNTWLYRPLLSFMDKREASITQDLQHVQQSDQEIIRINEEIKQIIENARLESTQIIEQASNEAKLEYEAKIAKKKVEFASKLEDFFVELKKEESVLKDSLVAHISDFELSLKTKISQM